MKSLWRPFAVIAVLSLVLAACGGEEGAGGGGGDTDGGDNGGGPATGEPIKIGYAGDFSEVYSYYDAPLRDGAQFAIEEINANGGVLGRPLELIARDNRNDVSLGTRVTQELLDEGIAYMIGTTSDPTLAQAQLVCGAGIPMSTGDSTAPTLVPDMGECAFQLVMTDNTQGAVAASYARDQGYETAYLLGSPEIPYTDKLPDYFAETFEAGGGSIVGEDLYTIDAGDYSAQVTKIAGLNPAPDVIFTPMFIPDTPVFLRQLRQAGVDVPVISTDGNHDDALLDTGARVLDGFVFTTHSFPAEGTDYGAFADRYEQETGSAPVSVVVGVGYDEIYALKAAIESAGGAEPDAILEGMRSIEHDGVTGTIRMNPDTRLAEKEVTLVRLDGDTMAFVDSFYPETVPAP
jgi:branched-chain amino acid transport system substrate-binding protein